MSEIRISRKVLAGLVCWFAIPGLAYCNDGGNGLAPISTVESEKNVSHVEPVSCTCENCEQLGAYPVGCSNHHRGARNGQPTCRCGQPGCGGVRLGRGLVGRGFVGRGLVGPGIFAGQSRNTPPGDMMGHVPYETWRMYYYDRPYQMHQVLESHAGDASIAAPTSAYANDVFQRLAEDYATRFVARRESRNLEYVGRQVRTPTNVLPDAAPSNELPPLAEVDKNQDVQTYSEPGVEAHFEAPEPSMHYQDSEIIDRQDPTIVDPALELGRRLGSR